MTYTDLRILLDFHYWARDRVLEAAELLMPEQLTLDVASSFKSVRDTVTHTYLGEWAWYMRWNGESPSAAPGLDLFADVPALRAAWSELESKVRAFVDRLGEAGIEREIDYTLI